MLSPYTTKKNLFWGTIKFNMQKYIIAVGISLSNFFNIVHSSPNINTTQDIENPILDSVEHTDMYPISTIQYAQNNLQSGIALSASMDAALNCCLGNYLFATSDIITCLLTMNNPNFMEGQFIVNNEYHPCCAKCLELSAYTSMIINAYRIVTCNPTSLNNCCGECFTIIRNGGVAINAMQKDLSPLTPPGHIEMGQSLHED